MNYTLYRTITSLSAPLVSLYLRYREAGGKEDPLRRNERIGIASLVRPEGKLVWVHAASVGESISVLPLIHQLTARYPAISVMITSGTVTSAAMIASKLPPRTFHQYVPVDTPQAVRRFISHWRPDLVLWMESELWPNLLTITAKQCPLILLNGRMSEKSLAVWKRFPGLARFMLGHFSLILPQSEMDNTRFAELGASKLNVVGNLKYDAPALPVDDAELQQLQQQLVGRPLWVAASTHDNEEQQLAEVHQKLMVAMPDLLTIIIPRHATRGKTIATAIRQTGLNVALRSDKEAIEQTTNIYIADTMGELGLFYRLAPIVFIGGSLIPHGGQNPLEAARLNCAILSGKHYFNFIEIYDNLVKEQAALIIEDNEDLATNLAILLGSPEKQHFMAEQGLQFAAATQYITSNTLDVLADYIR